MLYSLFWISLPLKMGQICCLATLVRNFNSTLHNDSEECRFGNAGLGLAPHGLVQSDVVWCCICESPCNEWKIWILEMELA